MSGSNAARRVERRKQSRRDRDSITSCIETGAQPSRLLFQQGFASEDACAPVNQPSLKTARRVERHWRIRQKLHKHQQFTAVAPFLWIRIHEHELTILYK